MLFKKISQHFTFFLSTLYLMSFCGPTFADTLIPIDKTILILGDSLSAGHGIEQGKNWTDLLQKKFNLNNNKISLINASISGHTTANGINRLPQALKQHRPDIIMIELGGNDGLRGLPIQHIKKNLATLIQLGLDNKAIVLLMHIRIPPNYGKKYTRAFNQVYSDLAEKYSLNLLPFMLEQIALKPELMQADGIHPNASAQPEIMEITYKALKPIL
jgi:acyl-CoA thioesterase I